MALRELMSRMTALNNCSPSTLNALSIMSMAKMSPDLRRARSSRT